MQDLGYCPCFKIAVWQACHRYIGLAAAAVSETSSSLGPEGRRVSSMKVKPQLCKPLPARHTRNLPAKCTGRDSAYMQYWGRSYVGCDLHRKLLVKVGSGCPLPGTPPGQHWQQSCNAVVLPQCKRSHNAHVFCRPAWQIQLPQPDHLLVASHLWNCGNSHRGVHWKAKIKG